MKNQKSNNHRQKGKHSGVARGVTAPKFNNDRVVTKSPAQYITKPNEPKKYTKLSNHHAIESKPAEHQVREYPAGLEFIKQIVLQGQNKVSTSFKVNDNFNLAKHEAIEIQGWKLWKNKLNKLVVVPIDAKDDSRRYYTFNYEPGILYFIQPTSPNQIPYVYFRGTKFQNFVEKYKINKVIRKNPNGLFAGKMVRANGHWAHEFAVFTTGDQKLSTNKDLSLCVYSTIKDIPANQIKSIEVSNNASLTIAVQSSIDNDGKLTLYRTLIISEDMYEHELYIKEFSKVIDQYFI